ncbi:MAG: hypothetical protein JJ969_00665 [Rhizobiaceae bacterium]|nr:hypothetical protein [Rhizobiaceae bacterium]
MWHPVKIAVALVAVLAVAACTGSGVEPSSLQPLTTDDGSGNANQLPPPNAQGGNNTLFSNNNSQAALPRVAAVNSNARIQFAPVIGAAAEAVPALSARLRARANQRAVTVAGSGDPAVTHVMKGYFSAFTDRGETTVIYVWDVLDPAGNRLHRIQGQQAETGTGGEGWNAVTAPTMEVIADRTVDELAVWLSSSSG